MTGQFCPDTPRHFLHENRETSEMSALRWTDGRRLRPHGPCARLGGVGQRRSTDETLEQGPQTVCGECGGKAAGQGEHPLASHAPDTARGFLRVPGATGCAASARALSVIHPRQEPYALMSARTDPCGGCRVTGIPTATVGDRRWAVGRVARLLQTVHAAGRVGFCASKEGVLFSKA